MSKTDLRLALLSQDTKKAFTCKLHTLKAIKVGNPMIYQCLVCGKILKSKKEKKK